MNAVAHELDEADTVAASPMDFLCDHLEAVLDGDAPDSPTSLDQRAQAIVQRVAVLTNRDVADEAAARVDKLDAASKQIGEIVETIEKIAQHTSLLAVNASIEAARAGRGGTRLCDCRRRGQRPGGSDRHRNARHPSPH